MLTSATLEPGLEMRKKAQLPKSKSTAWTEALVFLGLLLRHPEAVSRRLTENDRR